MTYRLGRSRLLALGVLCLWLAGAVVTAAWWQAAAPSDTGPAWGALAVGAGGLWALRSWQRLPQGLLCWQAQGWTWHSPGYPGGSTVTGVQTVLDLQRLVLLRMSNPDDAHWLVWADAATDPGSWLDFRRALKAHAGAAGAPSGADGRDVQP